MFPREFGEFAAEVAVAGNLAEIRGAQIEALDDRRRTHIHGRNQLLNLFAGNFFRAEGIDQHGNRLGQRCIPAPCGEKKLFRHAVNYLKGSYSASARPRCCLGRADLLVS